MHNSPSGSQSATAATPARAGLFRNEAIEYLHARQYGTVLLTQPLSHKLLTAWFTLLAVVIVLFFCAFDTTRKAECRGILLPGAGTLRIIPTQSGAIVQLRVREGQKVQAGDVLFILSSERSSANADSTGQAITNLLESRRSSFDAETQQSRLQAQQRVAAARQNVKDLTTDVLRLENQKALQIERVALAEQALKRYADLQLNNYFSAAQMEEKQAALLDQRQRMSEIERMQSAARRDLLAAEASVRDLGIQSGREVEALRRNVATVQQDIAENEARREILIRAPAAGTVTAIAVVRGQTVVAGAALASLLPANSELEAEVYVPSHAIGFIQPGMDVRLRYPAYPYQKFGQHKAKVTEVVSATLTPQELSLPAAGYPGSEPLYRVRLRLEKQTVQAYGKHILLKSGMQVDASVVLEHRKLYEWVLEPLFSISGRV